MPSFIIIRLHPVVPVAREEFEAYLDGLTITAYDLRSGTPPEVEIGTATYLAPLPPAPGQPRRPPGTPNPDTTVVQHYAPDIPRPRPTAVATAVIEVPATAAHPEYDTSDVRLVVTRTDGTFPQPQVYYNVPHLQQDDPPDPADYRTLEPTSLYLALPAPPPPNPGPRAHVEVPSDGTPPAYTGLRDAIDIVLDAEPVAGGLTQMTVRQSRHVAHEIVANRQFRPLPLPAGESGAEQIRKFEVMYSGRKANDDGHEQDRRQFEAGLLAHYSTGDAEAERLTGFVHAVAAAAVAEERSRGAVRAGVVFPVLPAAPLGGVRYAQVRIVIDNLVTPGSPPVTHADFAVPAAFFYASGAVLSPAVSGVQRYTLATYEEEQQLLTTLRAAAGTGVIDAVPPGNPPVGIAQAVRRLRALGAVQGSAPRVDLTATPAVRDLVQRWLAHPDDDIDTFWRAEAATGGAHLDLVLLALTEGHVDYATGQPLSELIRTELNVTTAEALAAKTAAEWSRFFHVPDTTIVRVSRLPAFTHPGGDEERVAAFIRHVRGFFVAGAGDGGDPEMPADGAPPRFGGAEADPIAAFARAYGDDLDFAGLLDEARVGPALSAVFPDDQEARAWLEQSVRAVAALARLALPVPAELRFSVVEALYARGFTSADQVNALSLEDFRSALTGTVAYAYAELIHGARDAGREGEASAFRPVNDGCLVNCLPPPHLSRLGPFAYLQQLLRLSPGSTCETPVPDDPEHTLAAAVRERRGPVDGLRVTRANLETPVRTVDLVNESLARIAQNPAGHSGGAVFDTRITSVGAEAAALLDAVPEHSTPAVSDGFAALRRDFSAPQLPYDQPVDVNRSYLEQLGTSRFATMRGFRRDITEFCLDPAAEPAEFQRHLWRHPVRIDIAREYLGITAEEYEMLFTRDAVPEPEEGRLTVRELYGFPSDTVDDRPWTEIVTAVPEFLDRTGLGYCDFLELWQCGFVPFHRGGGNPEFPASEPCDLADVHIRTESDETADALRRLAVFIRLWHKVHDRGYGFTELRDICEVLGLFTAEGGINPDFIRQFAAFAMLRNDFGLALTSGHPLPEGATGAARTQLLALWTGRGTPGWDWALGELIERIPHNAQAQHHCGERARGFVRLLAEHIDPLSELAGFSAADAPYDTWHARPTHTLRLAEVLSKIYASDFTVGEILYLFANCHVDGDDPFPRQPDNEALDSPLGLPDDESAFSLWNLRDKLLAADDVPDDEVAAWDWPRIESTLREQFAPSTDADMSDALRTLAEHCFPSVLEAAGHPVPAQRRQYRTELADTAPRMWNTPPDGPFHYDTASKQLYAQLPLTRAAVLEKTARIRQLNPEERTAVRRLCFLPRSELAALGFLFAGLADAEHHLLEEPEEHSRWTYFRRCVARTHRRCRIIAEHLAGHVAQQTGQPPDRSRPDLAHRLLRHLLADENRATAAWENDSGTRPEVCWPSQLGGAFTALLGLCGTGLPGEFTDDTGRALWREVRGPLDAFGRPENAANAPVPAVLPDPGPTPPVDRQGLATTRNGFALSHPDGELLGGAAGFTARWSGSLLIERDGSYAFLAEAAEEQQWRVRLSRGRRVWVLLDHGWHEEGHSGPSSRSAPVGLRRGTYRLTIELARTTPAFRDPGDVRRLTCGFRLKYGDPAQDDGRLKTVPLSHLFLEHKDHPLADGLPDFNDAPHHYLSVQYHATLRDIRRTYQRAFKALLLTSRFGLSAVEEADDGQSEIGYLLAHPRKFAGTSHYRTGDGFGTHRASFDLNFLPLNDNYQPPSPEQDLRTFPSARRRQALFDWWERLFDYTRVRTAARATTGRPLWLLFHEAAENHPDDPAQLVWYLGVDISHRPLATRFFPATAVGGEDLTDERWPLRVWHADAWIRSLREHFMEKDIGTARPDLWAADDPGAVQEGDAESGNNDNLQRYVREGCLDNGEPVRPEDVKRLNDGLRERGRQALLAYLCGMDRVPLPGGAHVRVERDLSDLLLLDVEAGHGEFITRAEEAMGAVRALVPRARLGLEPQWRTSAEFCRLWDRCFATFRVWEAAQRRAVYREDWVEWDELERARESEGFRFLEAELQRSVLTVPESGSLTYVAPRREHHGLAALQDEPSRIQRLDGIEGFGLHGVPEQPAQPSWLSGVHVPGGDGIGEEGGIEEAGDGAGLEPAEGQDGRLPLWIQAAVRLGTRFLRVAAAAEPPASAAFRPRSSPAARGRCEECRTPHPAVVDEYYFWLLDARHFEAQQQDPQWSWNDPSVAAALLRWPSRPGVRLAWSRVHNGRFGPPGCSAEQIATGGAAARLLLVGRAGDSLHFEIRGGVRPPGHDPYVPPGFRYDLPTDRAVLLPLVVPDGTVLVTDADAADTTLTVASADALPTDVPYRLVLDPASAAAETVSVTGAAGPELTVVRGIDGTTPAAHPQGTRAVHRPSYPGGLTAHPYFAHFSPGAPLTPASPFAAAVAVAGSLRSHGQYEAALKEYDTAFAPLRSDTSWMRCRPEKGRRCCHDSTVATEEQTRQRAITLHELETLLQWRTALLQERTDETRRQARVVHDTAARILGPRPRTVVMNGQPSDSGAVAVFTPHPAPPNPRLMALYEQVEDFPGPYEECAAPRSPYRFTPLLQRAQTLTGELRTATNALNTFTERAEAGFLDTKLADDERQIRELTLDIRRQQWREADWQLQALRKNQEITQARYRNLEQLLQNGLSNGEAQHTPLGVAALGMRGSATVAEGIGQVLGLVPDPFVGFPSNFMKLPVGTKLQQVFGTAARISHTNADIGTTTAGLRLTEAGWERRADEWNHDKGVTGLHGEEIRAQILAQERRRDIALRDVNNQQRLIEHSAEMYEFLRDRFTSHGVQLWFQQHAAALHAQLAQLTLHAARQAAQAFHDERGYLAAVPLPEARWNSLGEGLLFGERMALALQRLEQAYLDTNEREYELTKRVSLRTDFPLEFLQLLVTGSCDITIPEWRYDQDHPGLYYRRIKRVSVTAPCVAGPNTGVHCRLTLLNSTTRISPALSDTAPSCPDGSAGHGYPALPGDPRLRTDYAGGETILTSTGQEYETGMFEPNLQDARRLWFELAGSIATFRIEMSAENNRWDRDTLPDFFLDINYTAREGGPALRQAAAQAARHHLPGEGVRYFDAAVDLPDAWSRMRSAVGHRELELHVNRTMFPYLHGGPGVLIDRIDVFVDAPRAVSSRHHVVEFASPGHPRRRIRCAAGLDWPGFFHGTLDDTALGPLGDRADDALGTLFFPEQLTRIDRVLLLCRYRTVEG